LMRGKEIMALVPQPDGTGHWVNITSVTTVDRLRLWGGGQRTTLLGTSIWDPQRGHVRNGGINFLTVLSLF